MKKVFITGGAGFIGSRVVREFLDAGYEVTVFDSFKQYLLPDPEARPVNLLNRLKDIINNVTVITGDTLNKDFLRRSILKVKPDVIVHTAALPLASIAIEQTEEAYDSILSSTINILEIIRDFDHNCKFLYTSSSMVYGDFDSNSVSENSNKDPKEIYGSIKLAGEIISMGYMKRYGIDVRIVRPTAVYGPYDGNQRVLYKFVTRALQGEKLLVDGDGSMALDFTFVEDTAQGIYKVSTQENISGEIFNIARGNSETLSSAIDIISDNIDGVNVEYRKVPSYMPKRGTLDISKAKRLVGFKPKYDLSKGLKVYIDHLKKNPI